MFFYVLSRISPQKLPLIIKTPAFIIIEQTPIKHFKKAITAQAVTKER